MKNLEPKKNFFKYSIGLLIVLIVRLLPHPPNIEPIMATMMPFSKKWGRLSGVAFTLVAILGFDLITGTIGTWSIATAGTYGLIAYLSGIFFERKESSRRNYVLFAVVATLLYDSITGIGVGVVFFDQSFAITAIAQIPFTLAHLAGNIVLSAVISPALYKWVIENPKMETNHILQSIGFAR